MNFKCCEVETHVQSYLTLGVGMMIRRYSFTKQQKRVLFTNSTVYDCTCYGPITVSQPFVLALKLRISGHNITYLDYECSEYILYCESCVLEVVCEE